MANNLTFNYLNKNDNYPEPINNGNIYFKLINYDENNLWNYNSQNNIFEIAVDLEDKRYYISPEKMASEDINGLLSKKDKLKLNNLNLEELLKKENLNTNINIEIEENINKPQGSFEWDDKNKEYQLSLKFPNLKGDQGDAGKDGDKGADATLNKTVNIKIAEQENEENASGSFEQLQNNEYQLSLNFPNLKGKKGDKGNDGITPEFNSIFTTLEEDINEPEATIRPKEEGSNKYDIIIKFPKNELKGDQGIRGYQGPPGRDATVKIEINNLGSGNTVKSITKGDLQDGVTPINVTSHNSPIITESNVGAYSILYKNNNNNYEYINLSPTTGILQYNNLKNLHYGEVPITQGGTGKKSFSSNTILQGNGENGIKETSINNNGFLIYNGGEISSKGKINLTNDIDTADFSKGAAFFNNDKIQFGTLPLSMGGTGTEISNSSDAFIIINKNGDSLQSFEIPSAGIIYRQEGNTAPLLSSTSFLPVNLGGTGATTEVGARIQLGATRSAFEENGKTDEGTEREKNNYKLALANAITPIPSGSFN